MAPPPRRSFFRSLRVGGAARQFDKSTNAYNDRFGRPAAKLYQMSWSFGLSTNDVEFDDRLEWACSEMHRWHIDGLSSGEKAEPENRRQVQAALHTIDCGARQGPAR